MGSVAVFAVAMVTLPHQDAHEDADKGFSKTGVVCALLAGALQALAYVIVQMLKRVEEEQGVDNEKRVHFLQINVSNALFGALVTPLTLWGPFKIQEPVALS